MVIALSSYPTPQMSITWRANLHLLTPFSVSKHAVCTTSVLACLYSKGNVPTAEVTSDSNERPVRVNNH